jgi:hypothetical protein
MRNILGSEATEMWGQNEQRHTAGREAHGQRSAHLSYTATTQEGPPAQSELSSFCSRDASDGTAVPAPHTNASIA